MILQFTCVGWMIHVPQTCYWRIEVRKALLNAPGGALSRTSNDESQIQQIGLFLKLLSGIIHTHFYFLYKANWDIISPFSQVFRFSKISHIRTPHTFFKTQNIPTLFFFSWEIFETSSLRYHRLSYTLVSTNLYFLKHILFSLATLLGHSLLLFFAYRIQSFHSRFV